MIKGCSQSGRKVASGEVDEDWWEVGGEMVDATSRWMAREDPGQS
jgi:hypothetical protein